VVRDKNYEIASKFVKVMQRKLYTLFWTWCIIRALFAFYSFACFLIPVKHRGSIWVLKDGTRA